MILQRTDRISALVVFSNGTATATLNRLDRHCQRRDDLRCTTGPSSWVSCIPRQPESTSLLKAAVFQSKNQCYDLALGEAQEPPKTGRVVGLPLEFSWTGTSCKGNKGILQLRKPSLLCRTARPFFMEIPFFTETEHPHAS